MGFVPQNRPPLPPIDELPPSVETHAPWLQDLATIFVSVKHKSWSDGRVLQLCKRKITDFAFVGGAPVAPDR